MIAFILLTLVSVYLFCGFLFAIPFVWVGVGRIDPHAAHGSWGFRILILPGSALLWPLLARRWAQGIHEPPEERNAHRLLSAKSDPLVKESLQSEDSGKAADPVSSPGIPPSNF